jgi:hypothetical protein
LLKLPSLATQTKYSTRLRSTNASLPAADTWIF